MSSLINQQCWMHDFEFKMKTRWSHICIRFIKNACSKQDSIQKKQDHNSKIKTETTSSPDTKWDQRIKKSGLDRTTTQLYIYCHNNKTIYIAPCQRVEGLKRISTKDLSNYWRFSFTEDALTLSPLSTHSKSEITRQPCVKTPLALSSLLKSKLFRMHVH